MRYLQLSLILLLVSVIGFGCNRKSKKETEVLSEKVLVGADGILDLKALGVSLKIQGPEDLFAQKAGKIIHVRNQDGDVNFVIQESEIDVSDIKTERMDQAGIIANKLLVDSPNGYILESQRKDGMYYSFYFNVKDPESGKLYGMESDPEQRFERTQAERMFSICRTGTVLK
jgi:hypothetical protein